jgi:hypothetical protein
MDNERNSQKTHYVSATEPSRSARSILLKQRYINVTIAILYIIHRPLFYLKHTTNNVCTSLETHYISATKPNRLMRSIGL